MNNTIAEGQTTVYHRLDMVDGKRITITNGKRKRIILQRKEDALRMTKQEYTQRKEDVSRIGKGRGYP